MKRLWLHSVRAYISLGLFFYYKKITLNHKDRIPKDEAVLFLGNHQNALLDPLLIATHSGRFSYFLTRASVFNNAIISKLLKSLLMLPVYRIRDGWNTISKNNQIFKTSAQLLSKQNAIVIFPEGSHNLNRTVRPLSKGFTRIIIETLETYPETSIQLLPVGFNYQNAIKFGDSVSVNFGEPIRVSSQDIIDKVNFTSAIKNDVFNQLCTLTTHIEQTNYIHTLQKLNLLNVDFLNPKAVNECIANEFNNCNNKKESKYALAKPFFKFFLILNLIFPYIIWKVLIQPKIKEQEFVSTFRFAVSITIVPIYLLIIGLILLSLTTLKFAISYILYVLLLSIFSVKL